MITISRPKESLYLDQTTPQTVTNGAPLFNVGLKSPKIYPSSDGVSAIQILKADGTTPVMNFDTTNGYVGIGCTPNNKIQVSGLINFDDTLNNVLLGTGTGFSIITSAGNVYIGGNAGKCNLSTGYNVGIGYKALELNEDAGNNVALGAFTLSKLVSHSNNFGNNVAIGAYCLMNNISSYNIGLGAYVMANLNNLSSSGNIGMGYAALYLSTNAVGNLAIGHASMMCNLTGNYNLAIGYESLFTQTANNANIAFGYLSMRNATGDGNIAIGTAALYSGVNSQSNIAIGSSSLASASSSQRNIAIGDYAAANTTSGSWNVFLGYQVAYSNQSNSFGIAIGYQTLYSNVAGGYNTVVGSLAFYNNVGGGNVGLGLYAGYYETGSNKLFIDNTTRASEADGRLKALIYGEFNTTPATQLLRINAMLQLTSVKSGATQVAAGAAANEIWKTSGHSTLPDNVLLIGV